jgi:tetratricopeptide (TPR) repeat protein
MRFGRRRLLMVLGGFALLLAAASPFLWAGYHWYAGRSALKRYHAAEARAHLDACLRVWPWSRSPSVHRLAARAARRDGDLAEARRRLHECQDALGDQSPETVLEWALLHASAGDLDSVEEHLKSQGRQDTSRIPIILEALIEGYLRMSRVLDALRAAEEWLTYEPDNVQALYLRGNIHRQVGAAQKCIPDYRRVVELDPDHQEARARLAAALLEIGRYEEAAQQLEIVRRRRPDDPLILARLALCRYWLGHAEEATALLDHVLARNPEHGLALFTRGQIALLSGQLPEAEEWLRQAVRALPNDYKAHYALWDCLRQEKKTEEAEVERTRMEKLKDLRQRQGEILTHLMSQRPSDPALHYELGTLYLQLGQPDVAEGWLHSALHLDERYVPALEALADFYQQRGDERAEEYRQRARAARGERGASTPR